MANNQGRSKILYVVTKANWGGAQRYVYDLATHAATLDYDVAVISGPPGELTTRLHESSIRTIEIPSLERDIRWTAEIRSFFSLFNLFRKEKPDIVHLNSSKIGGLGALAARLARVPQIIFTAHGWPFLENRPQGSLQVIKFLSWITILLSTAVIDISKTTREAAETLPGINDKLCLIYNGVDPLDPIALKTEAREALAHAIGQSPYFLEGKVLVGTISELTGNKGLTYSLEALKPLVGLPFVFIIMGEGEDRDKLKTQIRNLNLQHHVYLAGFVKNASYYLSGLDIFTLTSIKEGFPFSILEAGLAELPVVASSVGGIPEVLDENTGVLTRPGDVPALTQALRVLIESSVAREILGKNLRVLVTQKFTKEKMLEKTFALYSQLLQAPKA